MRIGLPRPLLTSLRHVALRRRAWLALVVLALMAASLGQAMHLHDPGHESEDTGSAHCSFCMQVERLASGPAEVPATLAIRGSGTAIEWHISQVAELGRAPAYEARGPPTA